MNTRNTNTSKTASYTKCGPGRRHKQGDGTHSHLTIKQRRAGMFGKGVIAAITARQRGKLNEQRPA